MYKKISVNNLQTYLIELPKKTKRWQIKLDFSAGFLVAPKNKREIPHLLEHYLIGCLKKAGLDSWATTDEDSVAFYIDLPQKSAIKKLTTFLSILLSNKIDDTTIFTLEKKIWKIEHLGDLDDPETLSRRIAINNLINDKPYSLKYTELSFEDVRKFYKHILLTSKIYLFIGTHQISTVPVPAITNVLALFDHLKLKQHNLILRYLAPKKVNHLVDTNRTNICLAWPAPHQNFPAIEHIGMMQIADFLCDSIDGKLLEVLREKNGLIYELEYYVDYCSRFGFFSIEFATLNEESSSCIDLILDEINNLISGKISNSTLAKLIKIAKAGNKWRWANNESRFKWIVTDIKSLNRVYDLQNWLSFYKEMTPTFISLMAKKYLSNNLQIVKTGKD